MYVILLLIYAGVKQFLYVWLYDVLSGAHQYLADQVATWWFCSERKQSDRKRTTQRKTEKRDAVTWRICKRRGRFRMKTI